MNKTEKIISIIMLIVILSISFVTTNTYAAVNAYEVGDINADGKINTTDLSLLAAHLKGLKTNTVNFKETLTLHRADFDGNYKIDSTDVRLLARKVKSSLVMGDLNGDGKVTTTDISIVASIVTGKRNISQNMKEYADVDGNGKIDSNDIQIMALRVNSIIKVFPAKAKKGDINLDGVVSITDRLILSTYLKSQETNSSKKLKYKCYRDQADINGDGRITTTDLAAFSKIFLNM